MSFLPCFRWAFFFAKSELREWGRGEGVGGDTFSIEVIALNIFTKRGVYANVRVPN